MSHRLPLDPSPRGGTFPDEIGLLEPRVDGLEGLEVGSERRRESVVCLCKARSIMHIQWSYRRRSHLPTWFT